MIEEIAEIVKEAKEAWVHIRAAAEMEAVRTARLQICLALINNGTDVAAAPQLAKLMTMELFAAVTLPDKPEEA